MSPSPVEDPLNANAVSSGPVSPDPVSSGQTLLPSRGLTWLLRLLCLGALSASGYLVWTALTTSEVYGCGGDVFDCGHVLTSGWSKWFGIPVSIPAATLYSSLLAVLFFFRPGTPERLLTAGWQMLTVGGIAAGLAALWFIGLQVFVIKHLCIYCLIAHSCGLILAGIVLIRRPLGNRSTSSLGGVAAFGAAVLIVGQILTPPPQTFIVEHFDVEQDAGQMTEAPTGAADNDLFAAPGDVFSAPGDVFAAPGEVVEPPDSADPPPNSTDTESVVGDQVPASGNSVPTIPAARNSADSGTESQSPVTVEGETSATPKVTASLLIFFPAGVRTASRIALEQFLLPNESTQQESENKKDDQKPAEKSDEPAAEAATPEKVIAVPEKPEPRIISGSGNQFRLNIAQWPLLGRQDAKYVFIEMFDYTCPHCRNTHRAIKDAFRNYGDDLAVVALAVPLHPSCNNASGGGNAQNAESCELARIAIGVWRVKPDRFKEFHDWMFDGGRNRTAHEARQHAEKLVGKEPLQKELSQKTASEYISRHIELYKKVGSGSVPKLIFPRTTMTGEVSSGSTLIQTIQREMPAGLK